MHDPELYVSVGRRSRELATKLRIEHGGRFEDLPRRGDGSAIIADPRNDENMMISGLQAAFIKFHNNAVDLVARDRRLSSEDVFRKARELTTWHYQWMIVDEFLPQFIGRALVDDILRNGRRAFGTVPLPFIPVEFQGAAYRFGHSMVRPSYRANLLGDVNASGAPGTFLRDDLRSRGRGPAGSSRSARGAPGHGGASSAGRPSSISGHEPRPGGRRRHARTRTCDATRSSTPGSQPRCSTSPSAPSPRVIRLPRFRSATCCATSPGRSRPARASPGS